MHKQNVVYIEAYTGEQFMVYIDEDKEEKANMLAKILANLLKLKEHLVTNIDTMGEFQDSIRQLDNNFNENKTIIYETDPKSDLTSYSVNKGEELSFCLKSKKNQRLHDINLLMYVAIHELAHIGCSEIGHGALFKKIFKKYIEEAIKIGIYKHQDYSINNVEYCGMILSSSII